jgi:hypothetical protein
MWMKPICGIEARRTIKRPVGTQMFGGVSPWDVEPKDAPRAERPLDFLHRSNDVTVIH